jgi:hypothetical protein
LLTYNRFEFNNNKPTEACFTAFPGRSKTMFGGKIGVPELIIILVAMKDGEQGTATPAEKK